MFQYSYDSLVYHGESIEESVRRVARYGYDALELVGEPAQYDVSEVRRLTAEYGIGVSSICSIYHQDRDLSHPEASKREQGVEYVKRVAELAAETGAPVMIVAPAANMRIHPFTSAGEEWKLAAESIRAGGEYAASLGVKLCIEAWNRYETYMLNRVDQCLDMMRQVDLPNVGVMGDTFHMNLEEADIADAIRKCGSSLFHIHLADSNRAAPGTGHLAFRPVLQALKDIDYSGFLTFELLPAAADPFGVMRTGGGEMFLNKYTEMAIQYTKELERTLY
ncbi:TIM barrel protein [Paenibacillus sp. GCM10023252]|uniref:TIM barrel protein n=1 Tax=Paenibacillus sp. GCM10023252 TaxID=3252649 RepID=UPI00360A7D45